jgi:hypothetical protein
MSTVVDVHAGGLIVDDEPRFGHAELVAALALIFF